MAPAPIDVEDENEDGLSETQLINEVCPWCGQTGVADILGVQDLEEEVSPSSTDILERCDETDTVVHHSYTIRS